MKPVVVAGDGWAALASVAFLARTGVEVRWIAGSGSRILSPLPTYEANAIHGWKNLAEGLGIDCGEPESGSFLREFKNRAFREPAWVSESEPETAREEMRGSLWGLESNFVNLDEARFEVTAAELEEQIRAALMSAGYPNLRRIEGVPLLNVRAEGGKICAVTLVSGEEIETDRVIFAERWSTIPTVGGIPKGLAFTRKREAMGILQATFTHPTGEALVEAARKAAEIAAKEAAIAAVRNFGRGPGKPVEGPPTLEGLDTTAGEGLKEGFFGMLNRETGDEFERHAWGYFASSGERSFWTLGLTAEEVEDNHEISKRLRKLKHVFERMFARPIRDEQLRFEESMIFSEGDAPTEAQIISHLAGLQFLTDGYGPSAAMRQVLNLFGMPLGASDADSQAKGADLESPAHP